MRIITLLAGGAAMFAATAVAAPSAHEQHQASGQHLAATAPKKDCEAQMQEMMGSMQQMMQQMSEMHKQMMQTHQGMAQGMKMPTEKIAPGEKPQQPDQHQH
jgi:hypothetical protein